MLSAGAIAYRGMQLRTKAIEERDARHAKQTEQDEARFARQDEADSRYCVRPGAFDLRLCGWRGVKQISRQLDYHSLHLTSAIPAAPAQS